MKKPKKFQMNNLYTWIFIYIFFIFFAIFISYWLNDIPPKETALTQGVFTPSTAETPQEITSSNWHAITLPDTHMAKKLNTNEGWYMLPIPNHMIALKEDKLCIYIESLSHNVEVFLNTIWLGNGGRMETPVDRNAKNPLLFNIDRKQLKKEDNYLYIHIKGSNPYWTYLGHLYMGTESILSPIYNKQKMLRINIIIVTAISLFFTSLFAFLLWFVSRNESYYLWYAVAEILWAANDLNHFVKRIPVNDTAWETFLLLTIGWSLLSLVFFMHRYIGYYRQKIDRFILFAGGVLSLGFMYQYADWVTFYGYKIWMVFILFAGIYSVIFMLMHFYKTKDESTLLLLLMACVMISFGVHDLLAINSILPQNSPYIMHISAILIIVVISSLLIKRFMEGLRAVENHNKILKNALSERERQLAIEYQKNQKLEAEKLLNAERGRIMQDIHDGVGGQLVTMLEAVQQSNVPSDMLTHNLTLILQDLRLVIDSLDGNSQEITMILGTLRMRLEGLLEKANIKLLWKIDDLPLLSAFDPEQSLHTMRIVQEAITNVIRHSQATHISISTYMTNIDEKYYAVVEINDDGNGALDTREGGRGLYNMQQRARKMQALLKINAVIGKGVRIILGFPIVNVIGNTGDENS